MDYSNDKSGNYNITADFKNETYYNPSSNKRNILVLKLKTNIIVNPEITVKSGKTIIISGQVIDERENSVNNGTIIITLPDGTKISVNVINGKFNYIWTVPKDFKQGIYKIGLSFEENDFYYSSYGSIKLHIVSKPNPNPKPNPTPYPGKQKTILKQYL